MKMCLLLALIFLGGVLKIDAKEKDVQKTLQTVIINHIEYENAPINLVILDLRARVKKLSNSSKNLNIILGLSKGKKAEDYRVNLVLDKIPLEVALKYITQSAGLGFFIRDKTVVISDKNVARSKMEIRVLNLRPSNGIIKKLDKKEVKKGKDDMENDVDFFKE